MIMFLEKYYDDYNDFIDDSAVIIRSSYATCLIVYRLSANQ